MSSQSSIGSLCFGAGAFSSFRDEAVRSYDLQQSASPSSRQGQRPHSHTVYPENGQLFPRILQPRILGCGTEERERNDWQRILFTPPSFRTLCCQCLTGSWLSRPRAFFHFKATEYVSVYVTGTPNVFSAFGYAPSLSKCRLLPPWDVSLPGGRCQCSVLEGTSVSWRPISSSTWAKRLRLPSGKCWASHRSRITPVGLDLVAK